jgi:hypothetical protein
MSAFENLKQRQATIAPETVKKVSAFDTLKQRQTLIEPQKEERKQGFVERVARGIASPVATILARPLQAGASLLGASTESIDKFSDKYSGGLVAPTPKTGGDIVKDIGRGIETVALGIGGGSIKGVGKEALKGATKQAIKQGAKEGFLAGGIGGFGSGLEQGQDLTGSLQTGLTGVATGAVLGGAIGGGASALKNKLAPTPEVLNTKLDDSLRNIFKDTTGDVNKINESAFKARKGLELLTKESKDISIPDLKAPLGSKGVKAFDIQKSSPNELLSGVLEMDKKIATNARKAVEEAKKFGRKVETTEAESIINQAVQTGEIPKATGSRLLLQIKSAGNDPVKIHDWVQDINVKYGKKYQRGTIEDTALGKVADDVANVFRSKLDDIVDRKGYAEAFSNNQELKRLLVTVAKKANKNINFGDIGTDAGLDTAISILTGNPAYMARTLGTGLFKGVLSNLRNQSGLRSLKKAAALTKKLPTSTSLPSTEMKSLGLPRLEAPKSIQLGGTKAPTTFEAPAQKITQYSKPQLQLPAPKSSFQGKPIALPKNISKTNLGTDELENAKLSLSKFNKTGDQFSKDLRTGKVSYFPKNKQGGFSKTGTALGGTGLGLLGLKQPQQATKVEQPKETKPTKFLNAIAYNETNTIKEPYSYSKFSGSKAMGDDMGRYQVTEGELKTYGKRYLGYVPTKQEFLSSPELQDEYMTNKYNYLKKEGYSDAEIADIHRRGIKNARPKGNDTYQSPDYVESFNKQLASN